MVVPYGIYMEDYSHLEEEALEIAHIDLIDEELLQKDREHAIIHIYISPEANPAEAVSFLEERFQAENIPYEIDRDSCVEEDWINNWKKYFHPIPVGEKLLIRPLWEDDYDAQGRTVLHLEPGLAFGHRHPRDHPPVPGALGEVRHPRHRLFGHGLRQRHFVRGGFAAGRQIRRGRGYRPLSREDRRGERRNQRRGGTLHRHLRQPGGESHRQVPGGGRQYRGGYRHPLKQTIRISIDSTYIVSGIIDTREQDVLAAIQDTFQVIERREEKGWVAMALKLK